MLTLQDLQEISRKAETDSELLKIEQRTINTLVHPLLDALGYDHSNPREVAAELAAGTGSEKVDYAIMRDDKPIILLECKALENSLGTTEINQLRGYFIDTDAAIGVLTNGVVYKFFTDLDKPNIMDQSPFLVIDIRKADKSDVAELHRFAKGLFDPEEIKTAARKAAKDANVIRGVKAKLERMYHNPQDSKPLLRDVVANPLRKEVVASHHELVKRAFREFARDISNTESGSEFPQEISISASQNNQTPTAVVPSGPAPSTPTDGWQSLSDFRPPNSDVKPTQMMFPDNSEVSISRWTHVMIEAVRWLTDNGHLVPNDCPIQSGSRYLIATEPIHPGERDFSHPEKVNWLYIEKGTGWDVTARIKTTTTIIEHVGLKVSQFKVRY